MLGLLSVVGGVVLLAFLGPRAFLGGQGPIVAGGLIAFGLFKVGTNIGTS